MKPISSRENPLVKQTKRLLDSSKARREAGLTIADGAHLVSAALDNRVEFANLLFAESALERSEVALLAARAPHVHQYVLPDALFASLSPVDTPTGIIGLLPIPTETAKPDVKSDWLVLDGVQDAGNVGTLLRTAAAAGVSDVLLGGGCAQAWSPKVLRAGMGAHFVLRLHESAELRESLAAYRGQIAATRLDGATLLWDCDLSGPVAWIFGAEGQGVSAEIAALAGLGVAIPMAPGIESLNVAAAAAICLFEQRRQRSE
jgi:TrmH family RNA methyltransferase